MSKISAVIITYNEEKNIGRCIDSVALVADEVIVLDSFSTDATCTIAASKGAIVYQQSFAGYVQQKNKAILLASHHYILLLDADEALDKDLGISILVEKQTGFSNRAYKVKRCNMFCGRPVRHGLWYPDKKIRLFDKRVACCGGLDPHDKVIVSENISAAQLDGELLHYTCSSEAEYKQRNEEVSTIAARSLFESGKRLQWSKLFFSPLWTFINGYILKLGFLNGRTGWIIALHTTRQSFQKYNKLRLLQQQAVKESLQEFKTDFSA